MPRNLSTAAKSYAGPMLWLAEVTTPSGATHYFAEDAVTVAGNPYLPYLRLTTGPRFTRSLQADFGTLELLNTDLVVGSILQSEEFEGALCELKQLLLGLGDTVFILRGRLTEQEETDRGVSFRLVSDFDPAQLELHARFYAQLCTWRFRKPPCGYLPDQATLTQHLDERAADIFSDSTIGDSTLAMTVDEHQDRVVVLTAGTGRGQKRRIRSNTLTTFSLYHKWNTTPDATTKFDVWEFQNGAPKLLTTAAAQGEFLQTADIATARTLGNSALAMAPDEHRGDLVRITAGTGAAQQRKIKTNDATTLTIEDDEPDFNPAPDSTSTWAVFYARCPKDFAPSCEDRARTEAFNGFPTLVPIVRRIFEFPFGGLPDLGRLDPRGRGPLSP
ncbi:MAG: hypothetical protein ACE5G6_03820 [Terriglobia bacterium]